MATSQESCQGGEGLDRAQGAWGKFVQETEHVKRFTSGWQEGLLVAGLTGVPVVVVLVTVPASRSSQTAALIAAAAAGVLLSIAALLFYFHWLTTPSRRQGWTTTTMVVLAAQLLVASSHHLAEPTSLTREIGAWGILLDLLTLGIIFGSMVLGRRAVANPHPLLLGIALATMLALLHALAHAGPSPAATPAVSAAAALLVIVVGHLAIAWLVLRDLSLIAWARHRLALTVALVGLSHVAALDAFVGWATDLAAAAAQVGAAVLWASATFVLLRDALATQHRRSIALEGSLLEFETNLRGSREQLHEIRSTVAGAASAARLLDDRPIDTATHDHLVRAISTELGRLERLMTQEPPESPGPVDLDATLDVLLESHRAQGRTVEWEPSGGTSVHARQDDVTEALNILLDNAATHGGTASRVAVTRAKDVVEIAVSDEGPGVPLEAREDIFDWGVHGSASPGEGIGLSVARRLVTDHGGTLTLRAASAAPGSAFVISLPAARRSEEGHARDAG